MAAAPAPAESLLRIQTIFYRDPARAVEKLYECVHALDLPPGWKVELHTGNCGEPEGFPAASSLQWLDRLAERGISAQHSEFRENLGFARGHNRLAFEGEPPDLLLLLNPDGVFAYDLLARLLRFAEQRPGFGAIEARQIPLEHPKEFDRATGETNWCSCSCVLLRGEPFRLVEGFDESFFLYCEDVDLSWRLRAAGAGCYMCPEAFFYHAKRLGRAGPVVSDEEMYYSSLAKLILYRKYGREDFVTALSERLHRSPNPRERAAVQAFEATASTIRAAAPEAMSMARFDSGGEMGTRRWEYPAA